jgi:hypothetical protein
MVRRRAWFGLAFDALESLACKRLPAPTAEQAYSRFPLPLPVWPGMAADDFEYYHSCIARLRKEQQEARAEAPAAQEASQNPTAQQQHLQLEQEGTPHMQCNGQQDNTKPLQPREQESHASLALSDDAASCSGSTGGGQAMQQLPSQLGFSQIDHGAWGEVGDALFNTVNVGAWV